MRAIALFGIVLCDAAGLALLEATQSAAIPGGGPLGDAPVAALRRMMQSVNAGDARTYAGLYADALIMNGKELAEAVGQWPLPARKE